MATGLTLSCPNCQRQHHVYIPKAKLMPLVGDDVEDAAAMDAKEVEQGEVALVRGVAESGGMRFVDLSEVDVFVCECGAVVSPLADLRRLMMRSQTRRLGTE